MIPLLQTNITKSKVLTIIDYFTLSKYPDMCAWAFMDILGGAGILLLYTLQMKISFVHQYTQPIPLPTGVLPLHGYYD